MESRIQGLSNLGDASGLGQALQTKHVHCRSWEDTAVEPQILVC